MNFLFGKELLQVLQRRTWPGNLSSRFIIYRIIFIQSLIPFPFRAVAKQYAEKARDARPKEIPVTFTSPGKEPLLFKAHFHGWMDNIMVINT